MGNLSPDLAGPVQLELARAVELPGRHSMPGGSRYELKWDGFLTELFERPGSQRGGEADDDVVVGEVSVQQQDLDHPVRPPP